MSDQEYDGALKEAIDKATRGMTSAQRTAYKSKLGNKLPSVFDEMRKEVLDGEIYEHDEELLAAYKKEMEKIRQGDAHGLSELKKKFRRRGLEIW